MLSPVAIIVMNLISSIHGVAESGDNIKLFKFVPVIICYSVMLIVNCHIIIILIGLLLLIEIWLIYFFTNIFIQNTHFLPGQSRSRQLLNYL